MDEQIETLVSLIHCQSLCYDMVSRRFFFSFLFLGLGLRMFSARSSKSSSDSTPPTPPRHPPRRHRLVKIKTMTINLDHLNKFWLIFESWNYQIFLKALLMKQIISWFDRTSFFWDGFFLAITLSILPQVSVFNSSFLVWQTFQGIFNARSRICIPQLKNTLQNFKRNDHAIDEYISELVKLAEEVRRQGFHVDCTEWS